MLFLKVSYRFSCDWHSPCPTAWPVTSRCHCMGCKKALEKGHFYLDSSLPFFFSSPLLFPLLLTLQGDLVPSVKDLLCDCEDASLRLMGILQKNHNDPGFPGGLFECLHLPWICYFQTSYYMRKNKTDYWFKLLWIFHCLICLIIVSLAAREGWGGAGSTQLDALCNPSTW